MDGEEERPSSLQICSYEEYKTNDWKARQRASVLWLISKACENQLPSDLREPYYRDHEDQDRLKPQIIHGLSTGSLYCSALANIYADPNYYSLNHHNILQVLMRKGVYIEEPPDAALTETVLGQTAPIRMSAHMAVIEGIMSLYIKEVLIPEKVLEVVRRFSDVTSPHDIPSDSEEAAILWINKCCVKMQHRIEEDLRSFHSPDGPDGNMDPPPRPPNVPVIQDFSDLSDGCCLAAVLSFYCPNHLPWQGISFNEPVSLADSLYNLQLVQRFCDDHLQNDVCFLTLEDFLYMHHTIRQNMLAFIADLMFLFEIRPASCVLRPGVIIQEVTPKLAAGRRYSQNGCGEGHMSAHRMKSGFSQQAISPIPDLRSNNYGGSSYSLPDINSSRFNISGGRTMERSPSTRSSKGRSSEPQGGLRRTHSVNLPDHERRHAKVQHSSSFGPQRNSKEEPSRFRSEEDEEIAGYFPDHQSPPEDSSLPSTLPGNSQPIIQEPLFPAQVKESKERTNNDTKVQEMGEEHLASSMRSSQPTQQVEIPTAKVNQRPGPEGASLTPQQDGLLNSAGLEDYYHQLAQEGNTRGKGVLDEKGKEWLADSSEKAALESIDPYEKQLNNAEEEGKATTSFAQLSKLRDKPATISIVYMQHEKDDIGELKSSLLQKSRDGREERHTSFAALPNTTTWQQQSSSSAQQQQQESPSTSEAPLATQLCDIRLKLEEKRRKIEQEKRRMESLMKKQRQKLGKAAFLQAVSKGGGSSASSESSPTGKMEEETDLVRRADVEATNGVLCMQDIEQDLDSVAKKWLKPSPVKSTQEMLSPIDSVDDLNAEEFQNSIEQLNSSLSDLQMDISRLNQRQAAIQDLVNVKPPNHNDRNFFLHDKEQEQIHLQQERIHQEKLQQQLQQEKLKQKWQQEKLQQQQFQQQLKEKQLQQQQQQLHQQEQQLKLQEQQRRSQWQEPIQPQPMYGQPLQHLNTSPRRGQWGAPMMPMHNPQYGSLQWQPMRPASVDPQMMMMQQQAPHSGYDQRPPSALPYVDSGFTLHPSIQDPAFSTPYQQFNTAGRTVYQNGPIEAGAGGLYDYRAPVYQGMPGNQFDGNYPGMQPYPPNTTHRLSQDTIRSPPQTINYQQGQFQPILPERTQGQSTYIQEGDVLDKFGHPVKLPDQPPSPPTKPIMGRTFRIPKSSKPGCSPPKEAPIVSSPSNGESQGSSSSPEKDQFSSPSSPPPNPPTSYSSENINQDPSSKATFYISFDDDQPKKARAKKPLRPREVKAKSEASRVAAATDEIDESADKQQLLSQSLDPGVGFFIGADLVNPDPEAECEMEKKKGQIMQLSLRRRIEQEALRLAKEQEYARQRDNERIKREFMERKKEEEKTRRQAILEQYRQRKQQELEQERDGNSSSRETMPNRPNTLTKPKPRSTSRPRPKSMHVTTMTQEAGLSSLDTFSRGSHLSLAGLDLSDEKDSVFSSLSHRTLGSPTGQARSLTSPTGPSQNRSSFLPPGLLGRHSGPPSDGASDAGSTTSSAFTSEYTGPKLFVKPTAKSNRGIILNAINTVLAGAVNADTKKKVLEEINRSESKHFLILFRDAGCQFRAMYSYNPDKDEVMKLYGIGPKGLADKMMDRFYKYNSGGKCFSQVQTKHLTVTIDAVTIHNSLWSGKKSLPSKKDFF